MTRSRAKAMGCVLAAALASPAFAQLPPYLWAPKPDVATPYGANKPLVPLAQVLARHKGEADWSQTVLTTKRWDAKWVQTSPGAKSVPQFYGDDRAVWVVWSGKIRFTIAGQQPFVAEKGMIVQAPPRTAYSLETVGEGPSLRFEVTRAGIPPVFPDADAPAPPSPPGWRYMKISSPTQPFPYDSINRPFRSLSTDGASPATSGLDEVLVRDADNSVVLTRDQGGRLGASAGNAAFAVGSDEFWLVLEGKADYRIEGVGPISAGAGDVVLAPPGRWRRAAGHPGGVDARLAFSDRPDLFENSIQVPGGRP
jgi:mannose-6-phosphate isomerase-like protein (cupin superfamily)